MPVRALGRYLLAGDAGATALARHEDELGQVVEREQHDWGPSRLFVTRTNIRQYCSAGHDGCFMLRRRPSRSCQLGKLIVALIRSVKR